MHTTVFVGARSLGRSKPIIPDWSVPLPDHRAGDSVLLRDLISRIVRQEVGAFSERQKKRRFVRVLTERQITEQAREGRIDPAKKAQVNDVDPETAVETALLAFEDGLYYVFIDDRQYSRLDQPVVVGEGSRVTFLRLVALTGG